MFNINEGGSEEEGARGDEEREGRRKEEEGREDERKRTARVEYREKSTNPSDLRLYIVHPSTVLYHSHVQEPPSSPFDVFEDYNCS